MGQTESRMPRRSSSSAFLLKPRTEINKHMGKQPNISHGMACMQGWRAHMEDAHVMRASLPGLEGWSFYAVLDGHAGKKVAEISGTTLAGTVLYEVLPVRDSIEGVQAAIRRAFIKHDHMLQKNPEVLRDRSGSTCTSVLITPTHFIFANVGDSRTVLVREGKVEFSTIDHKPTLPVERSRITGAGGCVLNGRVDGGLAVSRAFGDFDYKMRSDLSILQQKVSPEPDVTVISRTDKDEYLILACDGIWDVMTSNAAHRFVEQRLKRSKDDLASACEALVHRCLGLGSRDNMSAVLVVPTLPVYLSMPSTPPEKLPQDVCKAVIMRVAASVAFSAIASGIAHMIECRSTSFIPRYPIPVHCVRSHCSNSNRYTFLPFQIGNTFLYIKDYPVACIVELFEYHII